MRQSVIVTLICEIVETEHHTLLMHQVCSRVEPAGKGIMMSCCCASIYFIQTALYTRYFDFDSHVMTQFQLIELVCPLCSFAKMLWVQVQQVAMIRKALDMTKKAHAGQARAAHVTGVDTFKILKSPNVGIHELFHMFQSANPVVEVRRSGDPYWTHPLSVADILDSFSDSSKPFTCWSRLCRPILLLIGSQIKLSRVRMLQLKSNGMSRPWPFFGPNLIVARPERYCHLQRSQVGSRNTSVQKLML